MLVSCRFCRTLFISTYPSIGSIFVSNGDPRPSDPGSVLLRSLGFVACLPSGALLLSKMYGLGPMSGFAFGIALASCLVLLGLWIWARRAGLRWLAEALEVGFLGGLVGTL